jgi:peptidoglycan/LPS O-acetylase OafA/YrhL
MSFFEITEVPGVLKQKIFPSLNGLRGISILMVIIHHFILLYPAISGHVPFLRRIVFIGPLGVNIFFVISGFLITTLCLKEKIKTGDLSLQQFYTRRALRILPVAFLYIIVIALLNYIFKLGVTIQNFIAATFFMANLSYFRTFGFSWDLAHYWSLSVEEQFYIFMPFMIKKNIKAFITISVAIALITPLIYLAQIQYSVLNASFLMMATRYFMKFQGIAVGCIFSVLLFKGYINFGRYSFGVTIISLVIIFCVPYQADLNTYSCFSNLLISVFTGFIVINNLHHQPNFIFRFLNWKALTFIGLLSYSIYIWQQLFLSNDSRFPPSLFPLNLLLLMVIPCLSYFYYEKFFLRLKEKFVRVRN